MKQSFKENFASRLIHWYHQNKRDLPWRNTRDPYMIWLSEIILQQTRVQQGLPYYKKFLERFPDVAALANADEQEVLRLWQGLGYYSRARNLHKAAKMVHEEYHDQFPRSYKELFRLKGVGKYTAAAIASFAYNEDVAVVDGNVYRVLARLLGIDTDIRSPKAEQIFGDKARLLLPTGDAGTFNQAMMEFGAIHCTPQKPQCLSCPFANECYAYQNNLTGTLPYKSKGGNRKNRFFNYFIIENSDAVLMRQRHEKDIWQGLFEFVLEESTEKITPIDLQRLKWFRFLKERGIQPGGEPVSYKHTLSHQQINAVFWRCWTDQDLNEIYENTEFQVIKKDVIQDVPKPILINKYLNAHFF